MVKSRELYKINAQPITAINVNIRDSKECATRFEKTQPIAPAIANKAIITKTMA